MWQYQHAESTPAGSTNAAVNNAQDATGFTSTLQARTAGAAFHCPCGVGTIALCALACCAKPAFATLPAAPCSASLALLCIGASVPAFIVPCAV